MGLVFEGERDDLWVRLWDAIDSENGFGRDWGLVQRRKLLSPVVRVFNVTCKGLRDQHYPLFCVMSNSSTSVIWEDVAEGSEAMIDFTPSDLV